ncbi:MAG: MFS transporter [Firmicutes bacterium]|nr:MFS transporter [Bacillota bacterium]
MTLPNKSLKHWIVLICCCGLAASSVGSVVNTVGVYYTSVSESLGVLRGTFALHATFLTLAIAFVSLVAPKLMDKFNFKMLIIVGTALVTLSSLLMAMSNSVWMFYIAAIIKGAGAAIYNILLITTILNHWFKEKIGLATSITLSFSGVAGAVLSPLLTNIIEASGWRTAYIALGIISLVLSLPAILFPFHLDPKEDGLLPYGSTEDAQAKKSASTTSFAWLQTNFILFLIAAVLFTAITGLPSHLPGYAQSIGISASTGALMLSATMIGNISSKLLIGALADKMGAIKSVYVMMIVIAASVFLFMFIHVESIVLIASFIFGSCYSITAVGISLMTKLFFGEENYVKAYSIVSFGTNFGAAFAMSAFGYVYDFTQSYYLDFILILAFLAINLLILFQLKRKAIR